MEPIPVYFTADGLTILNVCIAFIMFAVSIDIKPAHFLELLNKKKAIVTGLISQLILLPFVTFLLVLVLPIDKGMALGMLLVAACPGGNVSNFFTLIARGNVALSVTLTAFSSLVAFIATPLNFFFWASMVPGLQSSMKDFQINFWELASNMVIILVFPMILGMMLSAFAPRFCRLIDRWVKSFSMIILFGFIYFAFVKNQEAFTAYFADVFWIVLLHNGLGLATGYLFSTALKNDESVSRTVAIETGIQNSGLGLILIFTFFQGNPSMAVIAAWWGVWHLVSGMAFAFWMRKRNLSLAA